MNDACMKKLFAVTLFGGCLALEPMMAQVSNPFGNALIPDMVADASIVDIDGTFYCYATTDGYGRGLETSGPPVVWKSKDFVHWSFNGIYYYLYTIGGDEKYQYAYGMSRVSPLGSYEFPEQDIISTTDYAKGVFGPGHGCVFHPEGTDDYYFAYLEFGRRSTNRQTYVNRLEFNEDGTIRPVELDLNGVGALREVEREKPLKIDTVWASSTAEPLRIQSPHTDVVEQSYRYLRIKISKGIRGVWEWNIY